MKKLLVILLLLSWLRPALAQTHTPAGRQRLNVAFVVFPGMEALDLTGPLDVLLTASNLTNGGYHCYTVALTSAELTTDQGGLHLRPDYTFATAHRPDIVVVPGGPGVSRCQQDAAFITQLKALSGRASQTMSVCTGALLLAQAGVLDGPPRHHPPGHDRRAGEAISEGAGSARCALRGGWPGADDGRRNGRPRRGILPSGAA